MKLQERRKAIKAIQDFHPDNAREREDPPIEVLVIAFLAFVGTLAVIYFTGVIIINLF